MNLDWKKIKYNDDNDDMVMNKELEPGKAYFVYDVEVGFRVAKVEHYYVVEFPGKIQLRLVLYRSPDCYDSGDDCGQAEYYAEIPTFNLPEE